MTTKIIKGETMSTSNGGLVRRRLSWLAGSSLVVAIAAGASGGVMFVPTIAFAANECAPIGTDPSTNGATADTFTCSGAYPSGITYSSAGSLTVASTGAMNVGAVGINLTGNGADSVTFTATGVITGTAGPVIDVSSVSGPISLTTRGFTGTAAGVTYGVNAVSTGGGSIAINNTASAININSTTTQSAIRAVSTGGNGDVSVSTGPAAVTGRVRGIEAQASGTGALTITTANVSASSTSGVAVAGIDATTGTGLLTITITDLSAFPFNLGVSGGTGAAIRTSAGGNAEINIGIYRTVSNSSSTTATLDLTSVGATTVNNLGLLRPDSSAAAIRATAGSFTLNNKVGATAANASGTVEVVRGSIVGRFDFTAVSGATTFNNDGIWEPGGTSDFGPGTGVFNNAGLIRQGGGGVVVGLETFNNSGVIELPGPAGGIFVGKSFSAPGADFVGSGSSQLSTYAVLDTTGGQASCATLPLASCLSLVGGSTSGVTTVLVQATKATGNTGSEGGTLGTITTQYNSAGIVVVDVNGGVSHAGDFILDPGSTNYRADPIYGAVLSSEGLLGIALQYDEANQRHYLASVVPGRPMEYIAALQEVFSIWDTTSDVVAGRQADLRDAGGERFWLRVAGERTTHDVATSFTAGGSAFQHADEYELKTTTLVGGYDLAAGDGFVLGLHGGAIKSTLERDSSATTDEIEGVVAGLYGGWWSADGLTLDGTINANFLTLDHDRSIEEVSNTSSVSVGVRLEAGWRLPLAQGFYVQPLATGAWTQATIKDVEQNGFDATWEDLQSTKAALGLRVGGDVKMDDARVGYWLTGRAWKEFAGDGIVTIDTVAEDVALTDDLGGEFQEVAAGLNLSNAAGTLSGFVSGGAKFGDASDSYSASFGVRVRW